MVVYKSSPQTHYLMLVNVNNSRYWLIDEKMVEAGHQKWPLYMPDDSLASCRGKVKGYWCVALCVCVFVMWCDTLLTARDDLMPWSWKKTFPPSSGHTALIWSLFIVRSCLPFSTPREATVLHMKRKLNIQYTIFPEQGFCSFPFVLFHSHSGEAFVLQPGFNLCRCGCHVQANW